MRADLRNWLVIFGCLIAIAAAGCGLPESTTSPTTTPPTESFSGTLALQGSNVFAFTVTQTGTVAVTLASLSPSPTGGVGLGIGTPSGTAACTLTSSTPNATAASTAQITITLNPGTFCVKVYDTGNVTTASTFTINLVHS
jgi:hypothetical protein